MDPATGIAIAKAGAGLLGKLFGDDGAAKLKQEADAALIAALKNNALSPEDYIAAYEQLNPEDLEFHDPKLEVAEQMGDTELAGITLDPAFKQAQMDALAAMSRRGQEGLTLEEEVARNEIMTSAGVANKGAQDAVLQQAARQGRLGAGDTLAAQMAVAGSAYSNAAQEAQDLAAQRDRRAMEAVLQSGNMAGNLRKQDYGEQANVAEARDRINEFNTRYRADANTRNVGRQNTAGETRASTLRDVTQSNLGIRNKQADQLVGGRVGAANYQTDVAKTQHDITTGEANRRSQASSNKGRAVTGAVNTGLDILGRAGVFGETDEEKQTKPRLPGTPVR